MKVALDLQLLLKDKKTGIGWTAENIMQEFLHNMQQEVQINCFTFGYGNKIKEFQDSIGQKAEFQTCSWFHDVIYRLLWNFIPIPYRFFFGKQADVTIFFNYAVPPGVAGKSIVFVHDMSYQAYPETVRKKTRKFLELSLPDSCRRADCIITISEFSKKEIIKYLKIEEEKIKVIPLGVDFQRFHPYNSVKQQKEIQKKYQVSQNYILYLGTIEPRKNLERLIRAYQCLYAENSALPDLVLAGKKGWMYEPIFQCVEELNLGHKVKFLGYVEDADVPVLLSGAKLFVFPSLYEGFGLPPLEAMACGVPVVTSAAASLPEVTQDAAILVDPYKIAEIRDGMRCLLEDEKIYQELKKRGMEQAKKFSWERVSKLLLEACEDLFNKTVEK